MKYDVFGEELTYCDFTNPIMLPLYMEIVLCSSLSLEYRW